MKIEEAVEFYYRERNRQRKKNADFVAVVFSSAVIPNPPSRVRDPSCFALLRTGDASIVSAIAKKSTRPPV
jgi:hypothetical protein